MEVEKTLPSEHPNHRIEIGESSWDKNERSIRWRYDNPNSGKFSPHGSSELPLYALKELIHIAIKEDLFTLGDYSDLIEVLKLKQEDAVI